MNGVLDILYEDAYLLIVNKPADMPVHPTKIHQTDTLANIVSCYQMSNGEPYTFRALNRLDKNTSGCVAVAKDRITYAQVLKSIQKVYLAVCEGELRHDGLIDRPITLAPDSKMKRVVCDDIVRRAVTHYHVLKATPTHTVLTLWLETGRTHQIRCHLSSVGHPLAGDDLYGGRTDLISRQALHCAGMRLIHPVTGKVIEVHAPIPNDICSAFAVSADMQPLFPVDASDAAQRS